MQHICKYILRSVRRVQSGNTRIASRSLSTDPKKRGTKTLFISTVWPQKNASGGGLRTGSLIQLLAENGYDIECVSPSKPNEFKDKLNELVPTRQCEANSSEFDTYLQQTQPELVIYDRFVMEEQFSWRVKKVVPNATHIVDTQDLHFLRVLRQVANAEGVPVKQIAELDNPKLGNINAESNSPEGVFLREIASLYRSDGTILVSSAESLRLEKILGKQFVDEKVCLAPFFYPTTIQQSSKKMPEHFFMIGNFRHPPNMDAYKWVCQLWPSIRAKLPKAELHIYGAYPPQDVMQMTNVKKGFIVKGFLKEDQMHKLASYTANFAPLRFGAGVKTKIVDGWAASVPCITTSIGAEGMDDGKGFGGLIGDTNEELVDAAVQLYDNQDLRNQLSLRGTELVNSLYSRSVNEPKLLSFVEKTLRESAKRRETDVVGNMLWYHFNRSTEYFSKYLELKSSIRK